MNSSQATVNSQSPSQQAMSQVQLSNQKKKRGVPEGTWIKCPSCKSAIFRKEAEKRFNVCPECGYHMYVSGKDRIRHVLDEGTFEQWDSEIAPTDPLGFADSRAYVDRLKAEQK